MDMTSEPSPSDHRSFREPESAPPPGSQTTKDLLEQVLQQTAIHALSDAASNQAIRDALAQVAARYRGQPISFDPIVVDLVHETLAIQFPIYHSPQRDWRAVSASIARVLWDDPVARERLSRLWEELSVQP